jgi:hypothetical protein
MTMSRREAMGIAKEVARAMQRLPKLIETYGPDQPDGTVIRFIKTYRVDPSWDAFPTNRSQHDKLHEMIVDGREYIYVAVRAGGRWYLTGPTQTQPLEWEELIDWLDEGEPVKLIEVWPYNLQGQIEDVPNESASIDESASRSEDWDPDLTKAAAPPEKRAHKA